MDYAPARQSRPPRLAITASFLLIAVFVIWMLIPRAPVPPEEVLPIPPFVPKVGWRPLVSRARAS